MPRRLFAALLLTAYSALLINMLVLKAVTLKIGRVVLDFSGYATGPANLVPFSTIAPYLHGERGLMIALFNVGGNIVLFIPLGLLVPFVYERMTWPKSLALALLAPLSIEFVQAVFRVGIFDIDDVILNGLGILLGYAAFTVCARFFPSLFPSRARR